MPAILTDRNIEDAGHVAEQLYRTFRGVLQLPSIAGLKASMLAARLGVGRMTCQRIVKMNAAVEPSPDLLTQIPGVSGLREFLAALREEGAPHEALVKAEAAVDVFDRLLANVRMSHTDLQAAIVFHFETTDPKQRLARRTDLFNAASSMMGQAADATISIMAIKLSELEGFNFEQLAVRGYAQMRASGSAMPIRLPINAAFSDYRKVEGSEAAREPQELIEHFCSTPLPTIDARMIKEENLAHIINVEQIPIGEPFDCFAKQYNKWHIRDPGTSKAIWLYIDYPSRRCTFDLYLHRDIERHNDVSADCHLWGTALLAPPEDLWMTRFSDQATFTVLGPGTEQSDSRSYDRHKELTQYMFDEFGWNADEFVGFRCEMEMPIWRSGVCLILDGR